MPFATCGAGGACVDTANDSANCGGCGKACDSNVCVYSQCAKRIFVTSTTTNADFRTSGDGLTEGSAICMARALAANLSGTYKAWLSAYLGSGNWLHARDYVTHAAVPYVRLDKKVVAANFTGLTSGTLTNPISVDEIGAPVVGTNVPVWTNTKANGTGDDGLAGCNRWNGTTGAAAVGWADKTNTAWTDSNTTLSCSSQAHLYCIED
jgi:hypothetical protein